MELANKLGARFALIVGDDEMAAGRYSLKNMSTGEQESLTREEIAAGSLAAKLAMKRTDYGNFRSTGFSGRPSPHA